METIFLFSALMGGTFLVCQFVMTLLGLSDGASDTELGDHMDAGSDMHDLADHGDGHGDDPHHSSWLFGIISFRTLVAAATFFGLSGMFMARSGADLRDQLLVSVASGLGALFGVHSLMKSFHRLNQNGTLRMSAAVGKTGTVNVTIPPDRIGRGKVLVEIQGRLEEVSAVTSHSTPLQSGIRVEIVGLQNGNLFEVQPAEAVASAGAPV